jgi:phosphopantetheinyl transferase
MWQDSQAAAMARETTRTLDGRRQPTRNGTSPHTFTADITRVARDSARVRVRTGYLPEGAEGTAARDVSVWRIDLREPAAVVECAADLLTFDERERADRGTAIVRRRRVLSRAALRIVLARCVGSAPAVLGFVTDPFGKPRLDGPGPHFSVSRSGDWCLIAVTSLGPVGIDVEHTVAFPELEGIVARRFAPTDARTILNQSGEQRLQAFYRCWTRTEAYLKASGVGLAGGLGAAAGDPDPRTWTVASVSAHRDLIGAVVVAGVHPWGGAMLQACPLNLEFATLNGRGERAI